MNNTEDLKALWSMQEAAPMPDSKELFQKAVRSKNKMLLKFILSALLLMATVLFLAALWLYLSPKLFSTKLGITLIICAIGLYLIASQGIIELLYKKTSVLDLSTFVTRIKEVRQKQKTLQSSVLLAYFILLSAGLFLYLIEYTLMMTLTWRFISYALTLVWILFNWFYIRPRTIKKQQGELDLIIDQLEKVSGQLSA